MHILVICLFTHTLTLTSFSNRYDSVRSPFNKYSVCFGEYVDLHIIENDFVVLCSNL